MAPPRPPFSHAAIRESNVPGDTPYTITLYEASFDETWELDLDSALGSQLATYIRQQQATQQPIDRLTVTNILNS